MSLALTAARAALLRKEASAGRIAVGLGALGAAGLGTAAGLGAFSKAPAAPPEPPPAKYNAFDWARDTTAEIDAMPPRRVPLREKLQKGVVGKVTQGVGDVLSRMHGRYAGGRQ